MPLLLLRSAIAFPFVGLILLLMEFRFSLRLAECCDV